MNERIMTLIGQEVAGTIGPEDRDELFEQMMMDPAIGDELSRQERQLVEKIRSDAKRPRRTLPLLSHAATFVIGIGVMLVLGRQAAFTGVGLASANVYEIDNVRSATPQIGTVRIVPGEPWVTFMAYPILDDYSEFEASVEAFTGEAGREFAESDDAWQNVWRSVSTVGNRDMVVLTLPAESITAGVHRLRVYGIAGEERSQRPIHQVVFTIEIDGE